MPFRPFYYVIVYVCSVIHYVQRPTGHVPSRTESDRGWKENYQCHFPYQCTPTQEVIPMDEITFIVTFCMTAFRVSELVVCMIAFSDSKAFLYACF